MAKHIPHESGRSQIAATEPSADDETDLDVLVLSNHADAPFMNQQLAALEDRGVSFSTRTVPGEIDAGVSRGPTSYLRFFPRVISAARDGYDLIHAHYGLTAPMALAQVTTPVVLSLWGTDLYGPARPITRLCAPLCDEVIVMSEAMRSSLGRSCVVIPDGVDLDLFEPADTAAARAAVGWPSDEYTVLFPYSPDRTVKDYPRARRVVDAVNDRIDQPVSLRTVSGVPHETIPTYMNAADALLLTSKREGSPNAVKEALACNLPVVALDVGDVRERLDGVTPSAVVTNDSELVTNLAHVLESEQRSNGRRAAHEVSLERTTDAILDVYRRVR